MAWEPHPYWLQVIGYWQTLITGVLAVFAAVGAIWATISAANRQVKAVKMQIAAVERADQVKYLSEAYAFFSLMNAALDAALTDYYKASESARKVSEGNGVSADALAARQAFRRTAFHQVRDGLVKYGGRLSPAFLELDRKIGQFGSKVTATPGAYGPIPAGMNTELIEELESIKALIADLFQGVRAELTRISGLLQTEQT